jgi:hypothetical protein
MPHLSNGVKKATIKSTFYLFYQDLVQIRESQFSGTICQFHGFLSDLNTGQMYNAFLQCGQAST